MLNYGYGILYARGWRAVALSGLNPYISFLHAPQKGKPTLVFDLIEEFRCQGVDRAVFTMITRGEALKLDKKTGLLLEKELIGGLDGKLSFKGNMTPFFPAIVLGEALHIGNDTTQGLGMYRILQINHKAL